jgi:hypothetical protein
MLLQTVWQGCCKYIKTDFDKPKAVWDIKDKAGT